MCSVGRTPEYLYILHLSLVSVSRQCKSEILVGSQFSSWLFPTWNQTATQKWVSWKEALSCSLIYPISSKCLTTSKCASGKPSDCNCLEAGRKGIKKTLDKYLVLWGSKNPTRCQADLFLKWHFKQVVSILDPGE